jgi:hypothetical protein
MLLGCMLMIFVPAILSLVDLPTGGSGGMGAQRLNMGLMPVCIYKLLPFALFQYTTLQFELCDAVLSHVCHCT